MRVTILTIGSRGDVQPYVALGLGLQRAGHTVQLITGKDFESLVVGAGLQFAPLDVALLEMAQSTTGRAALAGKGRLALMRQVMPMLRQMLTDAWAAAQPFQPEAVVFHPKAMAGEHIAEKLGVPAYLALGLPLYSPTRAFPSPIVPAADLGPLNPLSHRLLIGLTLAPYRGMINAWRRAQLGLGPMGAGTRVARRLYAYSAHVLPAPADWDDSTSVTGYWWLPDEAEWTPPADLAAFLEAGPPPVYIGFGSMAGTDPERTTRVVMEAVRRAGQRAVLAAGWGGLTAAETPAGVFHLPAAPHAWLFPRMAAVVHHGGAGTTGAGLRAGKPTVICPFFGDQPFWGRRVHALGAGPHPIPQKALTAENLAGAIRAAVETPGYRQRAAALGELLRAEEGVGQAVALIEARG